MMPELGMDIFDTHMATLPQPPTLEGHEELQPEADVMMEPPQDFDAPPIFAEQHTAEGVVIEQGMLQSFCCVVMFV